MSKRKFPPKDPFAAREAEKYDNPIPSREYILELLDTADQPVTHEQMCDMLKLRDEEQVEALRRRLIAMARDGQLISNRRGAFVRLDKIDVVRGRVQGHRDGYGFIIRADGGEDIYLHNRQMRKVFDGDEVLVRLSGEQYRGKEEGAIVEVLTRNTWQLAGRFYNEEGVQFVRPENPRITHDIMIPFGSYGGARHGQIVVAEITQQPDKSRLPMGRVIQVLGDHMAPGMEIELAIQAHGIPSSWPSEVVDEASRIPPEVQEADKKFRVDVRDLPFVTIDGEDARDFDDAVLCERRRGGWRLYVAIADVSHYVQVDSPLDIEARARGNSVYFPDYVVPMLPEALSNGLCSLNPAVDRLCMVCEMTISDAGRITGYQFYEAVMHSHARLTYTKVGAILTGEGEEADALRQEYKPLLPQLESLYKLFQCLRKARDERGAIDFETVETRILFNDQRKIERIVPVKRNDAHRLIEECMLCANVCAAKFLEKHGLIGLYRVHEGPTEQKLANLRTYLAELGLGLAGGDHPTSADYQQLLLQIQGRSDAHLIQTVMLRSLRQAMYQMENHGHFGLGYDAYTHFTSPIRRYPDLLVHRAIRSVIRSEEPSTHVQRVAGAKPIARRKIYPYSVNEILVFGEQCSRTERRADEATRDVVSWLKCEYLRDQVGGVYDGHVSSVTSFGLFVELNDLYIEGLVHITSLPHDYYRFDAAQQRLVGERTRRVFGLGDELVVRVVRVDLDNRKIDFEIESSMAVRRPASSVVPKAHKRAAKARVKQGIPARVDPVEAPVEAGARKKAGTKKVDVASPAKASVVTKAAGAKAKKQKPDQAKAAVKKGAVKKAADKAPVSKKVESQKTTAKKASNAVVTKAATTKKSAVKKPAAGKASGKKAKVKTPAGKTAVKTSAPAAPKTKAAAKPSAAKEASHERKAQTAASKTASTKVQPTAKKTAKSKAVVAAPKAAVKRPVAKVNKTD
ncbi:ribonuclease R [Cellvibrio japonicus]|uniref:Ribonuclease R n=1 Tax=Cellvibrio japonicus (strain Ueda107) TaxID=498211 RepID=B3PCT5_CELJU|nr:ribonuclease R [Cellvibrio japonicus]ACE83934.1 putative ribonuclease R [Cellvibrio japonicus Ueda107]QEI13304.1 ribonuclease R [Cellvibrio japonicus]QEI16878.1 ribonuclease R [Cellvibrio japonicus]QEI20456.1 ribonuclease R [Cellvibrio japonicus]